MKIITTLSQLTTFRKQFSETLAFVPTMGNLHAGHLSLVKEGKKRADKTMVSIFVNPLQFAPHEDFDKYPRTLELDQEKLLSLKTDFLFLPTLQEIYPDGKEKHTQVYAPEISKILCGESRPHFFQGVTTIVAKLFNLVQPHVAIFGEKDFQQLIIIKKMIADLNFDIKIIGMPTVREPDGLAMSSRNQYLFGKEREVAPYLYNELQNTQVLIKAGERDYVKLITQAKSNLVRRGFKIDYYEIRQLDLSVATKNSKELIILTAAYLGETRLIDNIKVT